MSSLRSRALFSYFKKPLSFKTDLLNSSFTIHTYVEGILCMSCVRHVSNSGNAVMNIINSFVSHSF
jgi:hypothetical protein